MILVGAAQIANYDRRYHVIQLLSLRK